jgi:hypothetical protein
VDIENVALEIGIRQEPSETRAGRPSFADSQEQKILDLLLEAGLRGVSKKFLIFELHFTQASARVHSLERRGYKIRHEMRFGDRYTTFVLESSPERETPLPTYEKKRPDARQKTLCRDWFDEATSNPRPSGEASESPLFSGVR